MRRSLWVLLASLDFHLQANGLSSRELVQNLRHCCYLQAAVVVPVQEVFHFNKKICIIWSTSTAISEESILRCSITFSHISITIGKFDSQADTGLSRGSH